MNKKGDWIQTFSGVKFWSLDPDIEDVRIFDIAHALSNMCRYNGHCKKFYSVAEHSIIVSKFVLEEFALAGLLHDAAEAYLSDVPRPVKKYLNGYKGYESRLMSVIYRAFGIKKTMEMRNHVKCIDERLLRTELEQVMLTGTKAIKFYEEPIDVKIAYLQPVDAEIEFLERYYIIRAAEL